MEVPHVDDGGTTFLRALATHLIEGGLPLWRVSLALMTMHPEVLWRAVQASAVAARGGEVLKFIGDAVLAVFPLGDDPRAACRSALGAAEEAFRSIEAINRERGARGEEALSIGVALHRGAVMYGNIGARDRLDFTVISSAVNEASRLESLCKQLGTPLALSEAFVTTAEAEGVVDLGEHALKGVKVPLRVFTLRGWRRG